MNRRLLALLGAGLLAASAAVAQEPQKPAQDQAQKEEEVVKREEVVVVTASKVESTLINAPATMSVVTSDTIASSPAQNYGDLLRSVPGLNVIQTSARDINLTARQSTSTLVNSQLVLLDGRSVYLDFFGLVLWDFVPQGTTEIKQIEVVRGPASVVWGANALTGVVNIITKSPRDSEGFGLTLTGGFFNRGGGSREGERDFLDFGLGGGQYGANFSWADAPSERFSYRVSAGYLNSDPYSRPTGVVPLDTHPLDSSVRTGGAPYPRDTSGTGSFENEGTSQPKFDVRLDQEFSNGGRMTYQGGYAGTKGIIHTGIGPFDIESGSFMAYGRVSFSKGALKVSGFANIVDAEAPNLLLLDPDTRRPVQLNFKTQTYDFEIGNSNVVAGKHILSYGGNARRNGFDITLTPNSKDRNEFGAYFQEEFFLDKFRLAAGIRVDKFGNLDDPVFSPRVSVMFKPTPDHSIRVAFNRAFRSPSVVNNYLDQDIFTPTPVDLRPLRQAEALLPPAVRPLLALIPSEPFFLRVKNRGSEVVSPRYELKEESINAFEVAYTGNIGGKTTVGIALYRNEQDDNINFAQLTPSAEFPQGLPGLDFYSAQNPATGVGAVTGRPITLDPRLMALLAAIPRPFGPILLPRTVATYLNLGPIRNQGVELSVEHSFTNEVSAYANYSYQDTPKVLDPDAGQIPYPKREVGIPAEHRFNAGVNWNTKRLVGTVNVNFTDKAFWTDVLSEPYWGYTDSYTMVNASFGVKWADGKVVTSLKGTNLLNEKILQHIYGDLIKRSVVGEVRIFLK